MTMGRIVLIQLPLNYEWDTLLLQPGKYSKIVEMDVDKQGELSFLGNK